MNWFTDANPSFPYQSSFAREQLGVPDAAEVHLAICDLAELLLPVAKESSQDEKRQRITALRVASGAVLFGWSLDAAKQEVRCVLDLPLVGGQPLPPPDHVGDRNWLAEAVEKLRDEGHPIKQAYQSQRSAYGWRHMVASEP